VTLCHPALTFFFCPLCLSAIFFCFDFHSTDRISVNTAFLVLIFTPFEPRCSGLSTGTDIDPMPTLFAPPRVALPSRIDIFFLSLVLVVDFLGFDFHSTDRISVNTAFLVLIFTPFEPRCHSLSTGTDPARPPGLARLAHAAAGGPRSARRGDPARGGPRDGARGGRHGAQGRAGGGQGARGRGRGAPQRGGGAWHRQCGCGGVAVPPGCSLGEKKITAIRAVSVEIRTQKKKKKKKKKKALRDTRPTQPDAARTRAPPTHFFLHFFLTHLMIHLSRPIYLI
jgi:hypothetical protein